MDQSKNTFLCNDDDDHGRLGDPTITHVRACGGCVLMRRMKCGGSSTMNASFLIASDEFVDGDGDFGDGHG
eukprot:scaffold102189_cov64-Attheya_sp.AAC.5